MSQVKLDLINKTPLELVDLTRNIAFNMAGNADYPTPMPALAVLTDKAGQLEGANNNISALEAQLRAAYDARDLLIAEVKKAVTDEGAYVQIASGGDEGKIRSTGMDVRDEAKPIGALPAPEKPSLVDGHGDGELEAHCAKVRGAYSYFFETCLGDDPIGGVWGNGKPSGKTSITLAGFTLGSRVWMRVCGVGAAGQGDWSAPVSDIVT